MELFANEGCARFGLWQKGFEVSGPGTSKRNLGPQAEKPKPKSRSHVLNPTGGCSFKVMSAPESFEELAFLLDPVP